MSESSSLQLTAHLTGDDPTTQPTTAAATWGSERVFFSADAAGLASSFLQIRIESEPGRPAVRQLFFAPFRPDRTYQWEFSTILQPAWQPVIGDPPALLPNGEARVTDSRATEERKFYRPQIE